MEKQGKDLIFISQIKRDGSGTIPVKKSYIKLMQNDTFELKCLSITEKTWIVCDFNSFVVKLKK
jgi:hypothetical protein